MSYCRPQTCETCDILLRKSKNLYFRRKGIKYVYSVNAQCRVLNRFHASLASAHQILGLKFSKKISFQGPGFIKILEDVNYKNYVKAIL